MNFKHILVLAAASLLAAVGCEKPVDLGPEKVEIKSTNPVAVSKEGGDVTVKFVATVDWSIKDTGLDWIKVNPASGKAAAEEQTVTISVLPNEKAQRSATVIIYGNVLHSADVTVNQEGAIVIVPGEGTKDNPYSASEAKALAEKLDDKGQIKNVYVKGKVSAVKEIDTEFGNAEYSISDDGSSDNQFNIYRGYSLGGWKFKASDELKAGDDVIVFGTLVNFKGNTPQVTTSSMLVKLNDEEYAVPEIGTPSGTGTEADPFNAAAVLTKFNESGESEDEIFVKGTIVKIEKMPSAYNTADVYIADSDTEASLYVYHLNNFGGDSTGDGGFGEGGLIVGDEIVVKGKIKEYNSKGQLVSAVLVLLNGEAGESGEGGDDTPPAEPTLTKLTVAEFLAKPVSTTDWFELTGEITNIENTTYGNFTIEDATGEVYVYGLTSKWIGAKNDKSFSTLGLKVGDIVTLGGTRGEYTKDETTTPQVFGPIAAFYISHVEGVDDSPAGSVVLTFPDDNKANNKVGSYEKTWTAIIGENVFEIKNFNNNNWNWTLIKCGRKSDPSVASIMNTSSLPKVGSVVVTVNAFKAANKLNKAVLNVYSDVEKTNPLATDIAPAATFAAGDVTFAIPADVQAEGLIYELVFDYDAAGSNGAIEISKVTYIPAE